MGDFRSVTVRGPASQGAVTLTADFGFPPSRAQEILEYEPAVGYACRVTRGDGGRTEECDGVVSAVAPYLSITLQGEGWH